MTATDHDPDTWRPGDALKPGRPCPPHLDAAMRQAIADALAERERLDRERQEAK